MSVDGGLLLLLFKVRIIFFAFVVNLTLVEVSIYCFSTVDFGYVVVENVAGSELVVESERPHVNDLPHLSDTISVRMKPVGISHRLD